MRSKRWNGVEGYIILINNNIISGMKGCLKNGLIVTTQMLGIRQGIHTAVTLGSMKKDMLYDEDIIVFQKIYITINQCFYFTYVILLFSNSVSIPQNNYSFWRSNRCFDTALDLSFNNAHNLFYPSNQYSIHNSHR